jgi:hypothetical protein
VPGIDDLTAGAPPGLAVSVFGPGGPVLRDPLAQGAVDPEGPGILVHTIPDPFTADTGIWLASGYNGGTVVLSGGRVQITCNNTYPTLATLPAYDFRGSSMTVQVPQVPPVGNGSTEALAFVHDVASGNRVQMMYSGGQLVMREQTGAASDDTSITYSAVDHMWWRVSESTGTLTWETSPDGLAWTTRRTKVSTNYWAHVAVYLACGYYGTETAPGPALFDNLNLAPAPPITFAQRRMPNRPRVSTRARTTSPIPAQVIVAPSPWPTSATLRRRITTSTTRRPRVVVSPFGQQTPARSTRSTPRPTLRRSPDVVSPPFAQTAPTPPAFPPSRIAVRGVARKLWSGVRRAVPVPRTAPVLPSLTGLGLWLRADTIAGLAHGAAVASWTDESPAALTVTQGAGGSQPTYITGGMNGLPVVRFGGGHFLANAASYATGPAWTAFVVLRQTAASSAWALFNGNGNGFAIGSDGTGTSRELLLRGQADVVGSAFAVGVAEIRSASRDGNTLAESLRLNGAADATSGANYSNASGGLTIGAFEGGTGSFLTGDIAEIVGYTRTLSDYEHALVVEYLSAKWLGATVVANRTIPATGSRWRSRFIPRRPARVAAPVPGQVVPAAPTYPPGRATPRRVVALARRARPARPPVDQQATPTTSSRRARPTWRRLTRPALVVPPQAAPAAPSWVPGRTLARKVSALARRSRAVVTVPAQVAPAPPASIPSVTSPRRMGRLLRRSSSVAVVPAQAAVAPPTYIPAGPRLRRFARVLARPRTAAPTPPQVAPVAPSWVPGTRAPRRVLAALLRRKAPAPAPVQDRPPRPSMRRPGLPVAKVRHAAGPPIPQAAPPAVTATSAERRPLLRRKARAAAPVPQQATPNPTTPATTSPRRAQRVAAIRLRRRTGFPWLGIAPVSRAGKATAGQRGGPAVTSNTHGGPTATSGVVSPLTSDAGQHAGPGATSGTHTSPTGIGGQP